MLCCHDDLLHLHLPRQPEGPAQRLIAAGCHHWVKTQEWREETQGDRDKEAREIDTDRRLHPCESMAPKTAKQNLRLYAAKAGHSGRLAEELRENQGATNLRP